MGRGDSSVPLPQPPPSARRLFQLSPGLGAGGREAGRPPFCFPEIRVSLRGGGLTSASRVLLLFEFRCEGKQRAPAAVFREQLTAFLSRCDLEIQNQELLGRNEPTKRNGRHCVVTRIKRWACGLRLTVSRLGLSWLVWLLSALRLKLNFPFRTGLNLHKSGLGVRVARSLTCELARFP